MQLPRQKDIIVIEAEPHSGKEYGGHSPQDHNIRRHMVVMSSDEYTAATGMVLVMPITTSERYRNNPHYLPILLPGGSTNGVKGYIALWQLQNYDFKSRNGKVVNSINERTYDRLLFFVKDMLGI
ncbi:type II toxin-antitoxin system PemK/MazF family toxin [Lactobacillus sp. ESL0677]|uniref:type II toxin-antitoxin system PemK/MazF family toxin n=1 Tax=Lactobacillus sp. ESL0677 TaxID=2983208 RepID=UPI0023F930C8|nr:type II toxin-antitoxin system PemK/MazF family toxin [Lactobacillus sp. ESL0677]WEV37471.1 type II toxin-antitoxin system PemK/MazF family toxin [Lactobacillus sp. ESL0677]